MINTVYEQSVMEVRTMRKEICRRTSTAADTAWLRAVVTRKTPNGSDRKTEMRSIFDVYDKCVRKGVSVRSAR